MAELITMCGFCGSSKFAVVESYAWRGDIHDSGVLSCTNGEGGVDHIECATCGEPCLVDGFAQIDFN